MSRIRLVKGTYKQWEIDLVDEDGQPIDEELLEGALATFKLRESPTDVDVLLYTSEDPDHLEIDGQALRLTLQAADTSALVAQGYVYEFSLVLADGNPYTPIEWSPFDLVVGGTAETAAPVFTNTVRLDHDYGLPDALKYVTGGGSPIASAQVRVYYKTDYDAGNLTTPVGITETNAYGRWTNAIFVLPGYTYTVQFLKPNEYGPDKVEVVA